MYRFCPSEIVLSTMFIKNGGRDESLGTATCLTAVVGGMPGHALCNVSKVSVKCIAPLDYPFCVS